MMIGSFAIELMILILKSGLMKCPHDHPYIMPVRNTLKYYEVRNEKDSFHQGPQGD